jgi:tetratricopeptide (TPR) repeat protein
MRQNRLEEALAHAESAIRMNPYMPEPVNTRGEIYMMKGEPVKAAESFLIFLQLRPEDSRGYWNVALAFERSGQLEKAYQYVNQFLMMEQDPRYRQAAMQLVSSLQSRMGTGRK